LLIKDEGMIYLTKIPGIKKEDRKDLSVDGEAGESVVYVNMYNRVWERHTRKRSHRLRLIASVSGSGGVATYLWDDGLR
jgi:hypothetical protein